MTSPRVSTHVSQEYIDGVPSVIRPYSDEDRAKIQSRIDRSEAFLQRVDEIVNSSHNSLQKAILELHSRIDANETFICAHCQESDEEGWLQNKSWPCRTATTALLYNSDTVLDYEINNPDTLRSKLNEGHVVPADSVDDATDDEIFLAKSTSTIHDTVYISEM